ncbi:MAG: DUF4381 family protein [Alphaproteobacteria bacterium]|nr:DUF4381 family protein [Alphaproteobacteria bacterium]
MSLRSLEELKDIHYPVSPIFVDIHVILGILVCLIMIFVFAYFYTKKTIKRDTLKELKVIFDASSEDNFTKIQHILYVFKKYLSVKYPCTKGLSEEKMFLFLKEKYPKKISEKISILLQEGKFYSPYEMDKDTLIEAYNFIRGWIEFQK